MTSSRKILIAGAYGTGNIGDEAILDGILNVLMKRSVSKSDILVFSRNPEETEELHSIRSTRRNFWDLLKTDSIIIGGGELIQDRGRMVYQYTTLGIISKLLGKKVTYYAIGVSRLKSLLGRSLAKTALTLANDVSVRDHNSKKRLEEYGVKKKVSVVRDPSSEVEAISDDLTEKILQSEGIDVAKSRFLLGLVTQLIPDSNINKVLQAFLKTYVKKILDENMYVKIVFIPFNYHVDKDKDRDVLYGEVLKQDIEENRFKIMSGTYSPQELMGVISQMNLVVSTRLHPLLFSINTDTPRIGIGYFDKVISLGKENNFPIVELDKLEELYHYTHSHIQEWNEGRNQLN